jgi:hypothetical protein
MVKQSLSSIVRSGLLGSLTEAQYTVYISTVDQWVAYATEDFVLQALPVLHLREACVDCCLHPGLFIDSDEAEHQRLVIGLVV